MVWFSYKLMSDRIPVGKGGSPMATPARTTSARRPRRVTPLVDIEKDFLLFVTNWRTATVAGKARDKARDTIKVWFEAGGDRLHEVSVNEAGSQAVEFDEPLLIDGVKILGLENVRKESSVLDQDAVDDLLDSLPEDVRKRVVKKVVTYEVDPNELFKLNQEGIIKDDQLDDLYETNVSWSLTVKKA